MRKAPVFGLLLALTASARAQPRVTDPLAPMNAAIAAGDQALKEDEPQIAESRYREALYAGWMVAGAADAADGRFTDARDAFTHASTSIVDSGGALQSLAVVDMRLQDAPAAVAILTKLVAAHPKDTALERLLAQALISAKQPGDAVQVLVEAHGAAPDDIETTFALATGYLAARKLDEARPLFATVVSARPLAETYVLIGRAYRDAGFYDEARAALNKALAMNPRVKHAYYSLGTAAVMQEGILRVDEAIADFRHELAISPGDPAATLLLGMALVEAHHDRQALPLLKSAASRESAGFREYEYLGRCELALGEPKEAAAALRKAIDASTDVSAESRIGNLHYQLAEALRAAGDVAGADKEFAVAAKAAADRTSTARDTLQRYLSAGAEALSLEAPALSVDVGAFGKTTAAERHELATQVSSALARVYLNLGVMQAQASHFTRAADLLTAGAALDPDLPRLQYSLGVACFNAQRYDAAAAALERAIAADSDTREARRMLALASLNIGHFARAADLLRDDPNRDRDPSLAYVYGVALVHSGHAAEAETLFSTLLQTHADNPQLNVLLGEAHAEQGDFDGAIAALQHALALDPHVADADRSLGVIYMKQGRLTDAAAVLRAGLAAHPDDLATRYTLATVLDLDNQPAKALEELTRILHARPADADARYLTGKILLAQGSPTDAVQHLEIAERLEPADANIHYQLGLAYQKVGRSADAQKEFERFQALKQQRREGRQ